jgi:hypothetical protein
VTGRKQCALSIRSALHHFRDSDLDSGCLRNAHPT